MVKIKVSMYYIMNSVLKQFGLLDDVKKDKTVLGALYKPVKKDKGLNATRFEYPAPGQIAQADLLFMPNDRGYKYVLVVVDNGTRLIDAEPIKTKESVAVVEAFKKIFSRGIVAMPKKIEVDEGSEFKSGTAKYFHKHGVKLRVAATGRHRMQALVEKANQTLGTILHKRMTAQELLTGAVSREWVKDLPKLIAAVNTYIAKREVKRKKKEAKMKLPDEPVCEGDSCNLLSIGDRVRVALEFPIDLVTGAKLHGKFRSSDIKWDPKIRIIKDLLLKPNAPPMYLLDGPVGDRKITPIAYTKNQLNSVAANEKLPNPKVIRGKPTKYIIEKIVDKMKIKKKSFYLIKWVGFPDEEHVGATIYSKKGCVSIDPRIRGQSLIEAKCYFTCVLFGYFGFCFLD